MTINLEDNNPRIEYSVAQGVTQTTFAVPFEFFDDADLNVYVDGTLKVEGVDYTITGGDGSTGNIVFVTATPPNVQQVTGATGGSKVVIFRRTAIERTSDFSSGADINRAALNEQLDILTAMIADAKDISDRTIRINAYESAPSLVLPSVADRKGKVLAFHETTGAVLSGPSIASVQTVSESADAIDAIGDNINVVLDSVNQANAAAASASAASASASAAASSASAASGSASAANASAISAAASLDSFDDRYLGSKTSDPTLDNDGNALLVGALYYNSVNQIMKVYNGSAWLEAYASLSGALFASNNLSDLTNVSTARSNLGAQATITGAATTIAASDLTASRAVISNALGKVAVSSVTDTELGYVSGVTSAIQTQLDGKQPLDATLTGLANLANTAGLLVQTAQDTFLTRSITGVTNQILVTNATGVAGNINIAAVIATQGEAEAGTSEKLMTALRVEQAINVQAEGMVLLGTLTTTSGTVQTLSGLNLAGYKYLVAEFNGVSHSSGTNQHLLLGAGQVSNSALTSSNTYFGTALVALTTGVSIGLGSRSTLPSGENAQIAQTGYSTATTSVSVSTALGGTFDAGSVRIYGMR
jgi:hypothetical protein